jgi:hypothetical protein
MRSIRASRGSGTVETVTTEALVDMPEWTLCADQSVYARPSIDTKPRPP